MSMNTSITVKTEENSKLSQAFDRTMTRVSNELDISGEHALKFAEELTVAVVKTGGLTMYGGAVVLEEYNNTIDDLKDGTRKSLIGQAIASDDSVAKKLDKAIEDNKEDIQAAINKANQK